MLAWLTVCQHFNAPLLTRVLITERKYPIAAHRRWQAHKDSFLAWFHSINAACTSACGYHCMATISPWQLLDLLPNFNLFVSALKDIKCS